MGKLNLDTLTNEQFANMSQRDKNEVLRQAHQQKNQSGGTSVLEDRFASNTAGQSELLDESRRSNTFNQTLSSSAALNGGGGGTTSIVAMTLKNRSTEKGLNTGRQNSFKGAAAATLIGAEVAKGYSDWANSQLNIMANNRQAGEIQERSDLITGEILAQGRQVQGKQAGAFVKSGVKLSGSALNVMDETADKALDAALSVRREADFALGNIAMQTAVQEVDADFAALNTLNASASSTLFAFG